MRSPQNLLQTEQASSLNFVREMLQPYVHPCGSPGPTPTALYPYCTGGPRHGQSSSGEASQRQSRGSVGQSHPSPCCYLLCWCSPVYCWHYRMEAHAAGLHQDFSCPENTSSLQDFSLYIYLGLLQFKYNTLHLALSDLLMFTWACFASLSRTL